MPIESHDTLKWLFCHTKIPSIIDRQIASEQIHIDGMGDFIVEWHLSANLKALKSIFGVCGGVNTKYPCLYCMKSIGTRG